MTLNNCTKLLFLVACCFLLPGCCRESRNGDTIVFSYAGWVPLSLVLGGVACVGSGIAIRLHNANAKAAAEALPDLAKPRASASLPALRDAQDRMDFFRLSVFAWFLIAAGPFVVLSAPSYFLASVQVSRERLAIESGSWIFPALHDVRFKDLSRMELGDVDEGIRRREVKTYLVCHRIDGSKEQILIGELESLALKAILDSAKLSGLPVIDRRGEN